MLVYKCKICGGNLDIKDGDKLTTCPYCGSIQTIPNLDDEKVNKLFERGNELVRNCQFDDAVEKFEEILSIKNDDPEVYWSLLMAKFGVVYEKDPYTGNMLPTIHRNQDVSVFLDEDYKLTIEYSNESQRQYYEKTAGLIDRIQRKYNAICDKEDPFDIFICYKQTNDKTKKDTQDYKIAYDLYTSLTNEGYRVFFSHITLEDKIGEEYEPYIYAALKSSKVLLALGTKKEYYNAIWVKNEWSRFMHMMKDDHSKRLIPICDKSTSLPLEFSRYQAIQMNNSIVWKEDLIRNIGKILSNFHSDIDDGWGRTVSLNKFDIENEENRKEQTIDEAVDKIVEEEINPYIRKAVKIAIFTVIGALIIGILLSGLSGKSETVGSDFGSTYNTDCYDVSYFVGMYIDDVYNEINFMAENISFGCSYEYVYDDKHPNGTIISVFPTALYNGDTLHITINESNYNYYSDDSYGFYIRLKDSSNRVNIRSTPETYDKSNIVGLISTYDPYYVFDSFYDGEYTWYRIGTEQWVADLDGAWFDKLDTSTGLGQ